MITKQQAKDTVAVLATPAVVQNVEEKDDKIIVTVGSGNVIIGGSPSNDVKVCVDKNSGAISVDSDAG